MAMNMAMSGSPPGQYSIAQARDRLPALVHEAEEGTPVELTRRGKPVAVLLSSDEYHRLASGRVDFWSAYERFRESADLDGLDLGPVFEDIRDRSPGRDLEW